MLDHVCCYLMLAVSARAHMSLWFPGPLGGAHQANRATVDVDPRLNFPLGCCDEDGQPTLSNPGVCRGHAGLFDAQAAQVIWQPGQDAYFQLSDHTYSVGAPGSTHYGGSCQIGFSIDRGASWKVAASYNGNCPRRGKDGSPKSQTFDFKVPTGMPEGKALFTWIWLNREHESFMNCAVVHIGGASVTPVDSASSTETSSTRVMNFGGHSRGHEIHDERWSMQHMPTGNAECSPGSNSMDRASAHGADIDWTSSTDTFGGNKHNPEARPGMPRDMIHGCDWNTASPMEVSYYTVDAKCAPDAKRNALESDAFEIGWNDICGNFQGDDEFPIRTLDCGMSSSESA